MCKEVQIKKMGSFHIEKTYNKLLTVIRDVIDNHGLLNHDLNEVFNKELGVTKQINSNKKNESHDKSKSSYHKAISNNCKMVKEMFRGVVEHKYCLGVSHKMAKIMKEDPSLTLEEACRKGAEEMNEKLGKNVFPMDQEAFETRYEELHKCKIVYESD